MKRQNVQKAYQNICPDDDAKERMLQNILSSASEIPPAGKGDTMNRKMKPVVIAAIIALMILMMGCAIVAWNLGDMKIGEYTFTRGYYDENGYWAETEVTKDYLTLHGFRGSPTYLAHMEWQEFTDSYDPDHKILISVVDEGTWQAPEEYYAYNPYTQEMMDKVDEIAEKYGLNLLGACAHFQRWESDVFYRALGIDSLLVPESQAKIKNGSGYFYEAGNFKTYFYMTMPDAEEQWPYEMLNSIYYSKKDNFDDVGFGTDNWEDWQQWYYTTSSGAEVLIASSDYGARIFCEREDVLICASIQNHYESDFDYETNEFGKNTVMTKSQLESVANQLDFSLKVDTVDMDYARENLEQFRNQAN